MEDAHCAWLAFPGLPQGWAFFAVLDGPGGARAALFGARYLPRHMLLAWDPAPGEPEGVCGALPLAFWSADARLSSLWPRGEPRGSTAVVLLVSRRFLCLAHCGDSRAVLSRAGAVAFSTEGHRPLRLRERERIRALLCAQLLDTCLCKGGPDNTTCILVCFPGGPPGLARRKELELDAALGRRVAALCSSAQEPPSLNKVFRTLASEDIPDLPPGGGLYCMAVVIAEAYSQLFQAPGQRWAAGSELEGAETCSSSLTPQELNIRRGKKAPVSQELQQWLQSWFSSAALGHMPASHCVSDWPDCGHKPTPRA